ncbi:hypothetical protein [Streptomyces sp. NPDC060333]|uniref:hypothetical protein n=1 Tax=Streptomyces sp. NPDC060333 TaxID=3347098 RepID=UPI00364CAB58
MEGAEESKRAVFPDVVGRLAVQDPYTLADLSRDLTALLPGILAQPNVNIIDVTTLAEGEPVDSEAFLEGMAATGSGATVLTAPSSQEKEETFALVLPAHLRMKSFTCVRSTDDQWNGSDEIYWVGAAGADTNARATYSSPEFGDVDTGESRDFPAGSHVFSGELDQNLLVNIQCWEKDQGDVFAELRKALRSVADTCARAAVSIMQNGEKPEAALAAIIAVVAGLIDWLLGWLTNDDDLVGERSIAYTRAGLAALNGRETTLDFTGSGGHYRLTLACQTEAPRQPTSTTAISYRMLGTGGWGDAEGMASDSSFGPAAASIGSYLKVLFARPDRAQALSGRRCANGFDSWARAGWGTTSARPALGDYYGLYSAFRGVGTDRAVYWQRPDGDVTIHKFPGVTSSFGPALATVTKLHCVVRDDANEQLMMATYDGTTWTPFTPIPGAFSGGSPGLSEYHGKLYCAFRGVGSDQNLYWTSYDGASWTAIGRIPGGSAAGPALHASGGLLYCAVRGGQTATVNDQALYWTTFDGTWKNFTKINGAWSADSPALAHHYGAPDKRFNGFYLIYRGPGQI